MNQKYIKTIVKAALAEDIGREDITTNHLVSPRAKVNARIIYKSHGVVCGLEVASEVFKSLNRKVVFQKLVSDGDKVKKNQVVAILEGQTRAILTAERVALNFLTHLSAIATHTRAFVDQVEPYPVKIMDTRKTTPLLRLLERYAVRIGGGVNHRFDLSIMGMIKDNHRRQFQGRFLREAVDIIKKKTGKHVVLEVDTWQEFTEALKTHTEVILLDNMNPRQVHKAVLLRNKKAPNILLEASGGINLNNVREFAKTGVDRISIGSLTSQRQRIDISLDF